MTAAKARAFWKKLSLKAHPDKGGDPALFREMTDAKEKWEDLVKTEAQSGRPSTPAAASQQTETNQEEAPTMASETETPMETTEEEGIGVDLARPEDIAPAAHPEVVPCW